MKPSATTPVYLAVLGVSLLAAGILFHRYPLFDAIANLGFPYLAGMLGFAALVVGLHCVLFGSAPAELPLRANVALYVLIAGAANVNIIWDGVAGGFSHGDIWLNLANSVEFSLYYAAFLFLPRWMGKASPGSSAKDQSDRSVFLELLRAVFPKIVAMIYTAGTVVHILRLIFRFHVTDIPFEVDWVIVVLGPVGVVGLIVFSKHVDYRGRWEPITHWLIIIHLFISLVVHAWILAARSHQALSIFGYSYSYFATVYFAFFAWRSWTIRFRSRA